MVFFVPRLLLLSFCLLPIGTFGQIFSESGAEAFNNKDFLNNGLSTDKKREWDGEIKEEPSYQQAYDNVEMNSNYVGPRLAEYNEFDFQWPQPSASGVYVDGPVDDMFDKVPNDFRINFDPKLTGAYRSSDPVHENRPRLSSVENKIPPPSTRQPLKREGQEEFLTFVDPIPPKPSFHKVEPKLSLALPSIQKRVPSPRIGIPTDASDTLFIVIIMGCATVGVLGIAVAGVMFTRLHRRYKAAQEADYPQYGVTGPARERISPTSPIASMDAKLASSAQLYHYQHTKQQILTMEGSTLEMKGNESEESEGEGDEGDYSVYECPGLAPTGDLEIANPLFENQSPITKTSSQQLRSEGEQGNRPGDE